MIDPVVLTRELVDVPSTTGDEAAIAVLVESKLQSLGLETTRHPIDETRFNVVANPAARVILTTHLDTVPPFIASSEDENDVHGRGACDAKGIIASMLAAGERLLADGVNDFGFLFVVGEETDSIGAKRANAELDPSSEFFINGEPTGSRFVRAPKGALTAIVRFSGTAAHSAYPERGDSAIFRMAEAIVAIRDGPWGVDPRLGATTANVGVVRGGEKANVVASWAECEMIFRTAGEPDVVREKLEALVAARRGAIVRSHGNPPVRLAVPEGEEGEVVGFNTDVPHLTRFGEPILYGPGSILDAHSPGEKIAKQEILDAVDMYRRLVAGILSGALRVERRQRN